MAKSDGVAKTGPIKRRGLHESLAAQADAKARKKSERLAKKLTKKGPNTFPKGTKQP